MLEKVITLLRALYNRLPDRAGVSIVLGLMLVLSLVGFLVFGGENSFNQTDTQLDPVKMGDVFAGSLQRIWLQEDKQTLDQMIAEISSMSNVSGARLIDCRYQVISSSSDHVIENNQRVIKDTSASGCIECHQFERDSRPHAVYLEGLNIVRASTPIARPQEFTPCESQDVANMGVLLVDIPVAPNQGDSKLEFWGSIASLLLFGVSVYFIVGFLVTRRLHTFHHSLARFADGDLSARVKITAGMPPELRTLASKLNRSFEQVEDSTQEQEQQFLMQQRSVYEERERIARDLHDGLAQILTFVNTKSAAVRMMIMKDNVAPALEQLQYLEQEAQDLLEEVRMAIWGLRTANQENEDLLEALKSFTIRFSQLSQIPVKFTVESEVEALKLSTKVNNHLIRIVQEALVNVRKHAQATNAWVSLQNEEGFLYIIVGDDGYGFESEKVETKDVPRFGLITMQERARLINADLQVISEPGAGTQVIIIIPRRD